MSRPRWAFKLLTSEEHVALKTLGSYASPIDARDGYVHMCQASDVAETVRLYYAGRQDVMLARVDLSAPILCSPPLRVQWDHVSSRAVDFPHIYGGPLPLVAVHKVWGPLRCDSSTGNFDVPPLHVLTSE